MSDMEIYHQLSFEPPSAQETLLNSSSIIGP